MKFRITIFCVLLFTVQGFSQRHQNSQGPIFFLPANHESYFKRLPKKSIYKSLSNWQSIIDSTWGPGLPLDEKIQIFNAYTQALTDEFDGFESLQVNWDSLRSDYFSRITDSTSRGGFSAIMSHLAMELRDAHTYAYDNSVLSTPLNPGIPLLVISGLAWTVEHFGAVLTALPDSSLLVLRTVANHPLGLQPGDIVLGYEGIFWKYLVNDLLEAGLPVIGHWGGASSAYSDALLLSAGMNWHLFDTIDILKHSTGDTLHLSVFPLLNLPPVNMLNNEQVPVAGVPFPDFFEERYVSYGIITGTNIGYIYLYLEDDSNTDQQFYEALTSLLETDALIIDMRLNFGGWSLFDSSFEILFNETIYTIEDAYRCDPSNFNLCQSGNAPLFEIPGKPSSLYDRPIAILLGPSCVSMGDITAQRLRHHPTVKFFGKSAAASMGDNVRMQTFSSEWTLCYSISDMFHVSEPGSYLNRQEFPIDFPVWFTPDDVANGYDTVVERAIDWIENLAYAHHVTVNPPYVLPGVDMVTVNAQVENPHNHSLMLQAYVVATDSSSADSILMYDDGLHNDSLVGDGFWGGFWTTDEEQTYKVSVKTEDPITGTSRYLPNVGHFTTIGPVVSDGFTFTSRDTTADPGDYLEFELHLRNNGSTATANTISADISSQDTCITMIFRSSTFDDIAPGQTVTSNHTYWCKVNSNCPGNTVVKQDISIASNGCPFWSDSLSITILPYIRVTPATLKKTVVEGGVLTTELTIVNQGDFEMTFQIAEGIDWLEVNPSSGTIGPDGDQLVEVTIDASALSPGEYAGDITINSNDPTKPELIVTIDLTVEAARVIVSLPTVGSMPGETVHLSIDMNNQTLLSVSVSRFEIELEFDESLLELTDIIPEERAQHLGIFEWSFLGPGMATLSTYDTGGNVIEPGTNGVAKISFVVSDETPLGASTMITIVETNLTDGNGDPLNVEQVNGMIRFGPRGDVNVDGQVNIVDVLLAVNILLDIMTPTDLEKWSADCSGNGVVNIVDALGIVNVVLGIGDCEP